MKIVTLFGSFNPLTNAHIQLLKDAVKSLNADKGLFVATNDKYLKKKAVKRNDPIFFSEAEREAVIRECCEAEDNLEFWGFELGGAVPSRYKTLLKIKKQHPNAEIIEILGVDKLNSITRSVNIHDHLSVFKVGVFYRGKVDPETIINNTPELKAYKNSFIILPPVKDSFVSSTEVRRRYKAGEDFSDIVPPASEKLLKKYNPSDFTITFPERMAVLMSGGRFGMHDAGKEVYLANKQLFDSWKAGQQGFFPQEYKAFLDNTQIYSAEISVNNTTAPYTETKTGVINCDCVDLAERLIKQGYNPAILNLASARRPGGGYDAGYSAQEESLCQASNLSVSLYQFGDPKYKFIRESGVPFRSYGYPLDRNFGGIYTPNATFFRHGKAKFFGLREKPFNCDVITVAALSFNGRSDFAGKNELDYRAEDGGFTPEGEEIMLNKIRTIFRLAIKNGKNCIIGGGFGCGAYKLPAKEVARQFRQVLSEPEFKNKLRLVPFAILERAADPEASKFAPFYKEFGQYTD